MFREAGVSRMETPAFIILAHPFLDSAIPIVEHRELK